jgi:hypothetical protein
MWWQPEGTIPDIPEALRRLELLAQRGPTPEAFTFKHRFPPPEGVAERRPARATPIPASTPASSPPVDVEPERISS